MNELVAPRLLLLLTLVLGGGCDWGTEPEGAFVPTTSVERALVEEVVVDAAVVVGYAARFTDGSVEPPHLAFGGWLAGVSEQYLAHVSLATSDPGTYEEYCSGAAASEGSPDVWTEHDVCSRLRISDAYYVDLYFTERPHRLPDDRHPLSYPSVSGPEGTVVYPENPLVEWWYVFEPDGSTTVRADVDTRLRFEPAAGDPIVLDHEGRLTGRLDPNGTVVTSMLDLAFPGFAGCPLPVRLTVEDDGTELTGQIACGDFVLARIRHPGESFAIDWLEG